MNDVRDLRRENARLRLENVAHAAKINELETALAACHRIGVRLQSVLEYIRDEEPDADEIAALADGPSLGRVADEARRLHRAGLSKPV